MASQYGQELWRSLGSTAHLCTVNNIIDNDGELNSEKRRRSFLIHVD